MPRTAMGQMRTTVAMMTQHRHSQGRPPSRIPPSRPPLRVPCLPRRPKKVVVLTPSRPELFIPSRNSLPSAELTSAQLFNHPNVYSAYVYYIRSVCLPLPLLLLLCLRIFFFSSEVINARYLVGLDEAEETPHYFCPESMKRKMEASMSA